MELLRSSCWRARAASCSPRRGSRWRSMSMLSLSDAPAPSLELEMSRGPAGTRRPSYRYQPLLNPDLAACFGLRPAGVAYPKILSARSPSVAATAFHWGRAPPSEGPAAATDGACLGLRLCRGPRRSGVRPGRPSWRTRLSEVTPPRIRSGGSHLGRGA
jgi:hypothetical protein